MKAEIKTIDNVKCLVITIPLQTPKPSSSGKTLLVASASEKTICEVQGKPVKITLNAYIDKD